MSEPDSVPPEPTSRASKPRQRPSRLASETSERDLWDFDPDEETVATPPSSAPPEPVEELPAQGIPKPRFKAPKAVERAPRPLPAPTHENGERVVRQSAVGHRSQKNATPVRLTRPTDDIGELEEQVEDEWTDTLQAETRIHEDPVAGEVPLAEVEETDPGLMPADASEAPIDEPPPENEIPDAPQAEPDSRPIRERLSLTKLEKLGLSLLVVAMVGTGIFLLTSSFGRISTRSDRSDRPDFPIQGKQVRILQAGSYWREPVRSGGGAEAVRRETKLIPVLSLELEGGPCAIRAFFRDDKGEFVGDGVTRSAGSGRLEIAATAGFDDLGAHAAYRTGETRPWKIEIFEAPSVDSSRQEFRKILELPISTDRR